MKRTLAFTLLAGCALAQEPQQRIMIKQLEVGGPVGVGMMAGENVKGAPYSARIVTEMVQTLPDGNRIVQKQEGGVARDSQGRVRHEAILPVIGNMAAKSAPKMTFISDPVAGAAYSLNETDKTYRKNVIGSAAEAKFAAERKAGAVGAGPSTITFERHVAHEGTIEVGTGAVSVVAPPPGATFDVRVPVDKVTAEKGMRAAERGASKTESLGTKVIDGVVAEGTRTTRTIAAGEIGNEKPIEITSETWFSQELKTIVYSKRSDPRSGEMTYSLSNISRAEPDQSLFTLPADYKEASSKDVIFYRPNE